ncbi:hypothetical protein PPERSA_04944 [Pseudocohnilembus persalinus]|uniref:Uncharacterized protein n=1 Tax=Pseudocohnilembus persalinus TaxID=266149 RepID=A0A0V0QVD9_PSEPJ|nr:hypothetical protein PPERSA_04944 [Pseudocohnilembus persalinus]|eukprot:KRX06332.1 hypothetical protein PPERSA_04944 [Pseudocohnilembus persalinus]
MATNQQIGGFQQEQLQIPSINKNMEQYEQMLSDHLSYETKFQPIQRNFEDKLKEFSFNYEKNKENAWNLFIESKQKHDFLVLELEVVKLFCQLNQINLEIVEIKQTEHILDGHLPILQVNDTVFFNQQEFLPFLQELSDQNKNLDKQFLNIVENLYDNIQFLMFFDDKNNYQYRKKYNIILEPIKKLSYFKQQYDLKNKFRHRGILNTQQALQNTKSALNQLEILKIQQNTYQFVEKQSMNQNNMEQKQDEQQLQGENTFE